MITLCEYTKLVLDESLLDDIDDQLEAGDKMVDLERANNWAKNSRRKAWVGKQKKGYAMFGDFVIDDIDEKKYTGTPIKRATGSISISGCDIESLEGLFNPDCEIDGSLTIEDCPNLISLEGGPRSCKNLTISGCKKLKNLHCKTVVSGNLFLSGNGKKFKEEDIRKDDNNVYVIRKIFCSEIGEEANINESEYLYEAFAAPQLKILADAINAKKSDGDKLDMREFMANVQLDKIKSSQVHVYDAHDPWAVKDAKHVLSGKRSGFMFTINIQGEVDCLIRGRHVLRIANRYGKIDRWSNGQDWQVREIESHIRGAETLVIVDVDGMDAVWKIKHDRQTTRNGATAMMRGHERTGKITGEYWDDMKNKITEKDVRYFQSIADANRARYKEMATKIRAERAAGASSFEKYKTKIDSLFDRYTKLLMKIMKDPSKYSSYDVEWLNDKFNSSRLMGRGRYQYTTETGLFVCIERYFSAIISARNNGSASRKGFEEDLKLLETNMNSAIIAVDQKLSEMESK